MFHTPGSPLRKSSFPGGTQLTFIQAAAPPGWVRNTTFNDCALRVVGTATPGSGGTNAFSTVMAQTTTGATTITTGTMPSHTHPNVWEDTGDLNQGGGGNPCGSGSGFGSSGANGSGGAHSHSITMAMKYVDALIAKKA